jgi:hypothetical protein
MVKLLQGSVPSMESLKRKAKHEVHAGTEPYGETSGQGVSRPGRRMRTLKPRQFFLVEALHAQAHPRDPPIPPEPEQRCGEALWIGLHGDLRPGKKTEPPLQNADQAFPLTRSKQRRSSTSNVEGLCAKHFSSRFRPINKFPFERLKISIDDSFGGGHKTYEGAVGTLANAKREMHVDRERSIGGKGGGVSQKSFISEEGSVPSAAFSHIAGNRLTPPHPH